ncbi:MAG: hypothetical protein KAS60_07360 [Thermoplasmata archaeon]|nr:hypothetical protein [Candidatus Thermoplasmatota archaeon]MCK4949887.1 hypothetical protein [Thermoplasmata archaeon]
MSRPPMPACPRLSSDSDSRLSRIIIKRNGEVLEEDDAVREKYNRTLWHYKAQKDLDTEGCLLEVRAEDRPRNVTTKEIEL